jgi:hypothetical protein
LLELMYFFIFAAVFGFLAITSLKLFLAHLKLIY